MTDKLLHTILRVSLWVLFGITAIIAVVFILNLNSADGREAQMAAAQPMLYWTYILLIVAAFFAVIFPIYFVIRNPRKAIKALISLACLAIIICVAYGLSDSTPLVTATSNVNPDFSDAQVLSISDTGIYTTYILFGISILLLLYTGIRGIIRNL